MSLKTVSKIEIDLEFTCKECHQPLDGQRANNVRGSIEIEPCKNCAEENEAQLNEVKKEIEEIQEKSQENEELIEAMAEKFNSLIKK